MNVKINARALFHYILIYVLMMFQGSVFYKLNNDLIYIFVILVTVLYLLGHRKILNYIPMYFVYIIFFVLIFTIIYTKGSLSLGSSLNTISKFLLAIVVYYYSPKMFSERYLKLLNFIACFSLGGYFLAQITPNVIMHILPRIKYGEGIFYNSPFYTYALWHPTRNVGFMTEPGLYQILLNVGVFLILFDENLIMDKILRRRYLAVLILSIVTTQSTTGYIGTLIILLGWIFNYKKLQDKLLFRAIICTGLIFIIYEFWQGVDGIIYETLIQKLQISSSESNDLLFSYGSGKARIASMRADLKIANQYILGSGYYVYEQLWPSYLSSDVHETSSVSGLTISLAALGYPVTILTAYYYLYFSWKNKINIFSFLTLIALILNTSLAQPSIFFPLLLITVLINIKMKTYRV